MTSATALRPIVLLPLTLRAPAGGQGGGEATLGESIGVAEEPDADTADTLFVGALPDR